MLVLILINVPCLENVVDFEKCSNSQNHSSANSHNQMKISFIGKFAIALIWNGENKIIKTSFWKQKPFWKNWEHQFMSVIKLKPKYYIIILDFAKNFGRREWQAEMAASIGH